jgi:hypothetical protein
MKMAPIHVPIWSKHQQSILLEFRHLANLSYYSTDAMERMVKIQEQALNDDDRRLIEALMKIEDEFSASHSRDLTEEEIATLKSYKEEINQCIEAVHTTEDENQETKLFDKFQSQSKPRTVHMESSICATRAPLTQEVNNNLVLREAKSRQKLRFQRNSDRPSLMLAKEEWRVLSPRGRDFHHDARSANLTNHREGSNQCKSMQYH